jgi:peroxiredoxin Q/BCP
MHDDILESGYQVVAVSPQGEGSHGRFADRYDLRFPILADTSKRLIRAFGVDGPLGFGVRRATFLVGADGVIEQRHVSDFLVNSHLDFVKRNTRHQNT